MITRDRVLGDIIPRILLSAFAGGFAFLFITALNCPKLAESLIGNDPLIVMKVGSAVAMTAVALKLVFGGNLKESEGGIIELLAALLTVVAIIIAMVKCP